MALHYSDDVARLFHSCHDWLSPGGRIVSTVTHPVITSHDARASTDEPRQDWVVDDYFVGGPREQEWLGGRTRWYHRTIEEYVCYLHAASFALASLRECAPVRERFEHETEFRRRQRISLILLLAAARV